MISNLPSIELAKDAYAIFTDKKRATSLAKDTYRRIELGAQNLCKAAAMHKRPLLATAALTAAVVSMYLYGSELVAYMDKTCSPPSKSPAPTPTSSKSAPSPTPTTAKPIPTPIVPSKPACPPQAISNSTQTRPIFSEEDLPIFRTGTRVTDSAEQVGPSEGDQLITNFYAEGKKIVTFLFKGYTPGATYQPALEAGKKATEEGVKLIRSSYEPLFPLVSEASNAWENLPNFVEYWNDFWEIVKSVLPSLKEKKLDECVMNLVTKPEITPSEIIKKCTPSAFSQQSCKELRQQVRSVRKQIHPDKIEFEDPYKLFSVFADNLQKNHPKCKLN